MKHMHILAAYWVLAVTLLVLLITPAVGWADSSVTPAGGTPVGICVNGSVIDKLHKGLGPGIQVAADNGSGQPISTQTNGNGWFSFENLTPGKWTFRLTVPDSWNFVTPTEFTADLAYGHAGCYVIRFKLEPLGCVVVKKLDGNGGPLSDWNIKLFGAMNLEAKTDANGIVRFNKLVPGTYIVTEAPPDPAFAYLWKNLTPTSASIKVKPANDDKDCAQVEFKNVMLPTFCVVGSKVDDQHRPLPGWKIYAQPAGGGAPVLATETNEDGNFWFEKLTLGTWKLWEEVQPGWTPITPASFTVTRQTPGVRPDCLEVRFKNRPPDVCAEGAKLDEHGVGLGGWVIKAQSVADPALTYTTTTAANGSYRFNGLTLGEWVFSEEHITGWTPLTPTTVTVNLRALPNCSQVKPFRNQSPRRCIDVRKVDDQGAGLPGWSISLQPVAGGAIKQLVTDGIGMVSFTDLPLGQYRVWELGQPGWTPTTPTEMVVELVASDKPDCEQVEFINKQVPRDICIDGYKLDKNGNIGLPGWQVTALDLATSKTMTTTTDGLGYFRFSNLNPGKYEITVTEQKGWVPVGSLKQTVTVAWPPKLECTSLRFYDCQVGQRCIPIRPTPTPTPRCAYWHLVQPCQTLSGLARWYGVSMQAIMVANGIRNPDRIYIGQRLCIPPDP